MALQQFNQFEPKLSGLEGNMQAEPRVFAHDAVSVTIGAINNSDSNHGLDMTSGGTGYTVNDVLTAAGSATGTLATITVTEIIDGGGGTGPVSNYTVSNVGTGYLVGDNLTVTGGTGANDATFDVTNIDIPNTQRRGCCLYIGNSGDVEVVMESDDSVVFVGAATGAFLPILVKRVVVTNTTATSILALY